MKFAHQAAPAPPRPNHDPAAPLGLVHDPQRSASDSLRESWRSGGNALGFQGFIEVHRQHALGFP